MNFDSSGKRYTRHPGRKSWGPLAVAATLSLMAVGLPCAQAQPPGDASMARNTRPADLSAQGVRRIQQALIDRGYKVNSADGVWGPQTATALRSFQRDKGLDATGRADPQTLATLGVTRDGSRLPASERTTADNQRTPPIRARTPEADLDNVTIRAVQEALQRQGFQVGPVDGVWGAQTASSIGNFQRSRGMAASGVLDASTLGALGLLPDSKARADARRDGKPVRPADLDPAVIRMIQQALNDRGYKAGASDGAWGERTTAALGEFQRAQGIEPSGEPDVYTLVQLGLLPSSKSRAAAPR